MWTLKRTMMMAKPCPLSLAIEELVYQHLLLGKVRQSFAISRPNRPYSQALLVEDPQKAENLKKVRGVVATHALPMEMGR
jgi:hypothetical protein